MTKSVLIVEDDSSLAGLLHEVLDAEGFEVTIGASVESGVNADLVVVNGFDAVERLRALPRGDEVPIIVIDGDDLSAAARQEQIVRHRLTEVLERPLDLDRLIDALHDVFSSAYPEPRTTGEHRVAVLPEVSSNRTLHDVPDKGDLAEVPFATVLGKLFRRRASGALMLRKASVKKIVYLTEGVPVFVKSNLLAECLGRIMVQERLISQEECDESLRRKKQEKRRQGDILIQMGSISPHNLNFALELQMQVKLFDMFSWLEGRYQFNDRADYNATQIVLPMAPSAMIYEGASRAMSNDRIARELARMADAKLIPSADPTFRYQTLQLEPRAESLIEAMDGTRSVRGLLDIADFERAEAALLLYALCCVGLLEPTGEAVSGSHPIALDEGDVEILSTGEINAIAALGRVDELPLGSEPNWDRLAALIDASAEEALDPATEPPEPSPLPYEPDLDRWTGPSPSILFPEDEDDGVEDPLEGATEEAFSTDDVLAQPSIDEVGDTFESDPALPEPSLRLKRGVLARGTSLPRSPRWTPKAQAPEPPLDGANGSSPPLSEALRRQVRERLEAHVARIAEARASERPRPASPTTKKFPTKPSATSTYRLRAAPKDQEKEKKLEAELTDRLELMERQTYYELLEVADDARVELIRTAYHALARKHEPERIVGASTSRLVHKTAEQIYLLLTRALNTLTNEEARAEYDLRIGLRHLRQADLIAAESAFELGIAAVSRDDWRAARELFERAVRLNRDEGVYLAHLARALHKNGGPEERSIELLDRAAELSPRADDVHLFKGQLHEQAGRKAEAVLAYQRAVACNPDCVPALEALRVLDPPSHKKSGLLSRLNLS